MRVNTQCTARGAGDMRVGRGKDKTKNRDIRRYVEGREMGRGTQARQDAHYRDFQVGKQGI